MNTNRWPAGCAVMCLSPLLSAVASLVLVKLADNEPAGWPIYLAGGSAAAIGAGWGPTLISGPLLARAAGAAVSAIVGLTAYAALFALSWLSFTMFGL